MAQWCQLHRSQPTFEPHCVNKWRINFHHLLDSAFSKDLKVCHDICEMKIAILSTKMSADGFRANKLITVRAKNKPRSVFSLFTFLGTDF